MSRSMNEFINEVMLIKALSHPARLAILETLRNGEACVCHLEAAYGWRQAYISQQLMVLREAGIVADRREGWNIFYRVVKPEIYAILDAVYRASGRNAKIDLSMADPEGCACPNCRVELEAPAR